MNVSLKNVCLRRLLGVGVLCAIASVSLNAENKEDANRGQFTPDADYVLSGQLAADLPELPRVPFRYLTDENGFRSDRLSAVPEVGVHPRIVLSPSDIEVLRERVQNLDTQPEIFKVSWRDLRNKAGETPGRNGYNGAPWAGVSPIASRALVALLTDDEAMGRDAAEWAVRHAHFLEPRADLLNNHPETESFRHNFYYWSRTGMRLGGKSYVEAWLEGGAKRVKELADVSVEFYTKDNQWSFTSLAFEYDYAYPFMTDEERDIVRRVISKMSAGKYTTGMEIPGHFFINNHMSMGSMFTCVPLSIEGEEGYDPRILEQMAPRMEDKLTYDISPDGILYENVKGFVPLYSVWAVGRRGDRQLLRHNHLLAMVESGFYNATNLKNRFVNHGRDRIGERNVKLGETDAEERYWEFLGAGGFPHAGFFWNWVMAYFYPDNAAVDFAFKTAVVNQNYDKFDGSDDETNYGGKIHYNMRSMPDIMLLCASEGLKDDSGKPIDYNATGISAELQEKPMMWSDMNRGLVAMRSSWDEDALYVHYENRSDYYYGGHETPEHGDFRLSADGVVWSPYTGAYMNPYFHNMVLIDGQAGVYQPVAGRMIGTYDSPEAATIVSDGTDGYNWKKMEKNFYLWHNMMDTTPAHSDWLRFMGLRMNRDWELPFQPHMREFYDGFAHLDWGPWHGETRGPEYYQRWNDVERVLRTFHMSRADESLGGKPYVLVIDDVKKDESMHQFDWMFSLGGDVELYDVKTTTRNRHNVKSMEGAIGSDLIFTMGDAERKRDNIMTFGGKRPTIKIQPEAGDPMLLVRVLWRNTNSPYPLPSFEKSWSISHVRVSAYAVEPEFRVMLFPFRYGEDLPTTTWSDDRSQLTVQIGEQVDVYHFDKTDAGRTVFDMLRNGVSVAQTPAAPPTPKLDLAAGWSVDQNMPNAVREHHFADSFKVAFEPALPGAEIRYRLVPNSSTGVEETLDYSTWELYGQPFEVTESSQIEAVTVKDHWTLSNEAVSAPVVLNLIQQTPLAAVQVENLESGLELAVFETRRTIFNAEGFFVGTKNMLPDLSKIEPIKEGAVDHFEVPRVYPEQPTTEMAKGFYSYTGYFDAPEAGVYRFRVFSTAAVEMTMHDTIVLSETGPYGASKKNRYGEICLEKGQHPFKLVVCDPVFWKGAMEAPMPLEVSVMHPSSQVYVEVTEQALQRMDRPLSAFAEAIIPAIEPIEVSGALTPGWVESRYDWASYIPEECLLDGGHAVTTYRVPVNGLPSSFFSAVDQATPFVSEAVSTMNGNDFLGRTVVYDGYFKARWEGVYTFRLDPNGANELLIDGRSIVQNRIDAPELFGHVTLKPGYYPIRVCLATSNGVLEVKNPVNQEYAAVVAGDVYRPVEVTAAPESDLLATSVFVNDEGELEARGGANQVRFKLLDVAVAEGMDGAKGLEVTQPHSYIEVQGLNLPDDVITVSLWFKQAKGGMLINAEPRKFTTDFRGKDRIRTMFYRDHVGYTIANAGQAFVDGEWTHYAAILDTKGVTVYINGEQKDRSVVDRNGFYSKSTDARPMSLQLLKGSVGGIFSHLDVFNRALSADEVRALANQ